MSDGFDIKRFKKRARLDNRYEKQKGRLTARGISTGCIEEAVENAIANLEKGDTSALVIYGEPQSGKTEMMICLTAKLLDQGHRLIVHLLNDSVDLLSQSLQRFTESGLAPAARNSSELIQSTKTMPKELVVFCKKNARDLEALIDWLKGKEKSLVVIDDEADYATPNAKINKGSVTKINQCVGTLLGSEGVYIGVTATPARLNLNRTFDNDAGKWVQFPAHTAYTGQDVFFPLDLKVDYCLTRLAGAASKRDFTDAFVRFLVTSAYLNIYGAKGPQNFSMLVHTSGKKVDHEADRKMIEECINILVDPESPEFDPLVHQIYATSQKRYPKNDANHMTQYVLDNASRATLVVLNSERDRRAAGSNPTEPTTPFTIIFGGNIVSRGVTFPNLLSMFFTRDVRTKLQQDTYIQRARMFGARGDYLEHFELTIPRRLYEDWHRCFIFHKLALQTIKSNLGSPVWIGDGRIAVAASSSINRATVALDKGEMAFSTFEFSAGLDNIVDQNPSDPATLLALSHAIGHEALPPFLVDFINTTIAVAQAYGRPDGLLAIHKASSMAGYSDANHIEISRIKGFMGRTQMEVRRFPNAIHHVKIFYNAKGKARVFYKLGGVEFIQNLHH